MHSSSRFRNLAADGSLYVDELRMFLGGYRVAFGAPADVDPFLQQVSVPGSLQNGLFAMVRAVFYREQASISHAGLVDLLLLAVGGSEIDPDAPELQQARHSIARLVSQSMTSLWSMPDLSRPVPSQENDAVYLDQRAPGTAPTRPSEPELPAPWQRSDEPLGDVPGAEAYATVPPSAGESFDGALRPTLPPETADADVSAAAAETTAIRWKSGSFVWARMPRMIWVGAVAALLLPPGLDWLTRHDAVQAAAPHPIPQLVTRAAVPEPAPALNLMSSADAEHQEALFDASLEQQEPAACKAIASPAHSLRPRRRRARSRRASAFRRLRRASVR